MHVAGSVAVAAVAVRVQTETVVESHCEDGLGECMVSCQGDLAMSSTQTGAMEPSIRKKDLAAEDLTVILKLLIQEA